MASKRDQPLPLDTDLEVVVRSAERVFEAGRELATRLERISPEPVEPIGRGAISVMESYRLGEFSRRVGLGRSAIKMCRFRGLRTIRVGSAVFVRGADWDAFLEQEASRV